MKPKTFETGVVVRLKCGGHCMIIEEAFSDGNADILWMRDGKIQRDNVSFELLEIIDVEKETRAQEQMIMNAIAQHAGHAN